MKTIALPSALGFLFAVCLHAAPAQALPNTYVSRTGVGPGCGINDPCQLFSTAHDNTDNGGQITCLDSANYGFVTITKSITINCEGVNANSGRINISGDNVAVVLRGLNIYGYYSSSSGSAGVNFALGQELHIENCTITGFTNGNSGFAAGIYFFPSGASRLFVSDTVVSLNGSASNGGGIIIQPMGSAGSVRAVLNRVQVTNNRVGIFALGGATGSIIVEVRDSTVTGNQIAGSSSHGILAQSSGAVTAFTVDRSSISHNSGNGIMAQGAAALVHIGRSTVRGNGGGLIAAGGGSIVSYGDNHSKGNGNDGGPTGVLAPN